MDETRQKIIDAAMTLVRDNGYTATTTKEIAHRAGVNECTLFRKFNSKKDIILSGMEQEKWRPEVTWDIFENVKWELKPDLILFMKTYMDKITPDFVNLSIGLRAPQLYGDTAPLIMKIPRAFISILVDYFEGMEERGKITHMNFECLAMTIFSTIFGFNFLNASFKSDLTDIDQESFIRESVDTFLKGIPQI